MSESASFPAWIYKRDGRLVPFEPDKICQALFAASEALGHPDAFLARELTDGVLHFLNQDDAGGTPTTSQLSELIAKVVRELGQPALAQVFAAGARSKVVGAQAKRPEVDFKFSTADSPSAVVASCLRAYSLRAVFSRDLAAAQQDGLLALTGLEGPLQLAASVVDSPRVAGRGLEAALDAAQRLARIVCLDSPEHALAADAPHEGGALARRFAGFCHGADRRVILNLGCAAAPVWAGEGPAGPLFAAQQRAVTLEDLPALADALLEQLTAPAGAAATRIDWHFGERDFVPAAAGRHEPRLLRLARLAVESPILTFTFDRPRQQIALAEGVNRSHAAVLLAVGLHLPRLLDLPGVCGQASAFHQKLASLARLALSAAVQKRNYLRRQGKGPDGGPGRAAGFLLERARLVVVPLGLEAVVSGLTGCGLSEGKPGLDLGRQIIEQLRAALEQDGRRANLDCCIDGFASFPASARGAFALDNGSGNLAQGQQEIDVPLVAGVTPWAPGTPPRNQLRAAGILHTAAGAGTAALFLPAAVCQQAEAVAELLHFAWRQTGIVRLRLVPPGRQQQPNFLPS